MEALIPYYIVTIGCGIISAWLMHAIMLGLSYQRAVPVNMVKAIGSFATGELDKARTAGLVLHTLGGATLGVLYGFVLRVAGVYDSPIGIMLGSLIGLYHGFMVAYFLLYMVSKRHPLKQYRNASLHVGLVHLLGHVFYGAFLSVMIFVLSIG